MPFAATWMDLEIIILSEVRERKILYNITYMWNYKIFTVWKQTHRNGELVLPRVRVGKGWTGSLGLSDANCYTQDGKQQGPIVQHRGLYSIPCNNNNGKECEKELHIYRNASL